MFYSHEILTSRRNGVSTIWLAATVGPKSSTRKITRKAIQDVNIPKACLTIIDPGAPIALRLQSNLLYGVSRVYSQQYAYMLGDTEKVQAHIQTFYRVWGNSTIDLQADKTTARSSQFIIPDDPAFELEFRLPEFDLDGDGNVVIAQISQASRKTSSQLSPLIRDGSSGGSASMIAGLNISRSSEQRSFQLELPFGRDSMASQKRGEGALNLGGEEELVPAFDDWGIEIDTDGNVILAVEEPELPPLPRLPGQVGGELAQPQNEQGDVVMNLGEEFLPEVEAFPKPPADPPAEEEQGPEAAAAPMRQRRARRPVLLMPDAETIVSKHEFRAWEANYLATQEEALRNKASISTGPVQARKNAWTLLFGRGLMDVGLPTGIPDGVHPLAEQFAGVGLAKSLGINISSEEFNGLHGRRRSADEAFDMEDEDRRVRARFADGEQVGRSIQQQEDMPLIFDQDVEVGREPGSALSDIPSSVPWNRPGSSVHGSAKATSFLAGRQVSASPLHGRGSTFQEIERFSDQPDFGSDDFVPHSSSFLHGGPVGGSGRQDGELIQEASDLESRNFLGFVERVAGEKGAIRADDEHDQRLWVSFNDLFEPADNKKAVVTQAFCNVLSLATRNKIRVEQEGENETPFGTIRLGVVISE